MLIGDAAHTVPPTGAKGLYLPVVDVVSLNDALQKRLVKGNSRGIDACPEVTLERIWKAQHFSWWMTTMLHRSPEANEFDQHRQRAELRALFTSEAGRRYDAESYTGWPLHEMFV